MNSRWPEYDYYYHLNSIQTEVARNHQAEKAKQGRQQIKAPKRNLRSRLARTLVRLRAGILS